MRTAYGNSIGLLVPWWLPMDAIAAFDFDGTLTRRDCLVPFLRRVAGSGAVARAMVAEAGPLARRDRDALKAGVLRRLLAGRLAADVDAEGEEFATQIIANQLRDDTRRRIDWHLAQGHRTVIVSASLRPYLAPVGRYLGVEAVICTELEVAHGRLTGELIAGNCRGRAKAARLAEWLGPDAPLSLWAYGDSSGDDELLALAEPEKRVWV
jgi:phosphatidylglycerophosphatase C